MLSALFSKSTSEALNFAIDLSGSLSASEQITAVAVSSVTPALSGFTATPTIGALGTSISLATTVGGTAGDSYLLSLVITTSLAQVIYLEVSLAVTSSNPSTFPIDDVGGLPQLSGELYAGDSVLGNVVYNFVAGVNLSGAVLAWSLLDNLGFVHASGHGSFTNVTSVTGSEVVSGSAVISTPSNLPPSIGGFSYQIRWGITLAGGSPIYSFETLRVLSRYETTLGVSDALELSGTDALVHCILERAYNNVSVELFDSTDAVIFGPVSVKTTETSISGGVAYSVTIPTTTIPASLSQYTVSFKYADSAMSPQNRSMGKLFVITPSMFAAMEDLRTFINRTNTSVAGSPDMIFTPTSLLTFLRMGKDYFNMIFQITNFTMVRASGGIRDGWLACSSIRALRSQFIAEGEKAFDYQGQAISLNVDRTQYYDSLASNLEGQLEMFNKFKTQLAKRGITSGNGDLENTSASRGSVAAVGINLTPASGYNIFGTRRVPVW